MKAAFVTDAVGPRVVTMTNTIVQDIDEDVLRIRLDLAHGLPSAPDGLHHHTNAVDHTRPMGEIRKTVPARHIVMATRTEELRSER